MTLHVVFEGIDHDDLALALSRGVDHGGNPIEPFVDDDGGWPLRCCLSDSAAGDRLAIIAWSPYVWNGPYRETGPVVVHVEGCTGVSRMATLPAALNRRPMVLRPYGVGHSILYSLVTHVAADSDLDAVVNDLFANPEVVDVYAKNLTGGCFAFVARRARETTVGSPC